MGELRDRMERDMAIRGLRERTRDAYVRCVKQFAAYHRRSPAELGNEEICEHLLHLLEERELKSSSLGVHIGALKFLYNVTLERPEEVATLKSPKVRQRLPEVLTPTEVELLLMAVGRIKYRAAIMVGYGAGLRAAEICGLQFTDIDSERMLIFVRDGKGGKDRYTRMPDHLLSSGFLTLGKQRDTRTTQTTAGGRELSSAG